MFYADLVLSKKGPLARIWLAAHWDRKLTKTQVFETNIEKSVEGILQPSVRMALRTSGHLLLGVVRIYSRKTKYLLADCNEAFVKIKMAFRPGMVDLPDDHHETAVSAVTLPEVFHDFDSAMTDFKYAWNDVDIEIQLSVNQSRINEITMREDYAQVTNMNNEDNFGNFEIENADGMRDAAIFEQNLNQANLLFSENVGLHTTDNDIEKDNNYSMSDDFSRNIEIAAGGIFEVGGLFDETPMPQVPGMENDTFTTGVEEHDERIELEHAVISVSVVKSPTSMEVGLPHNPKCASPSTAIVNNDDDDADNDEDNFIPPSPNAYSSDGSRPASPVGDDESKIILETENRRASITEGAQLWLPENLNQPTNDNDEQLINHQNENQSEERLNDDEDTTDNVDQTMLVNNDEETFALHPIDATYARGMSKSKRKRKLVVDEIKSITGDEMKTQMVDTSDIVTTLDLAPPTKRLMHWKETGGVEKLFALSGKHIPAESLFKNYQRFLTSKTKVNEDVDNNEAADTENIKENIPPLDVSGDNVTEVAVKSGRRGRKRKHVPDGKTHAQSNEEEYLPVKRVVSTLQENTLSQSPHSLIIRDSEESRSSLSTMEDIRQYSENITCSNESTQMEVEELENVGGQYPSENNEMNVPPSITEHIEDNDESDHMVIDFHNDDDDDDDNDGHCDVVVPNVIEQDGNVDCDFTNENPEAIGKSNVVDATTDDVHDAESIAETSALSADLSQQSPVHVSVDDGENEKCDLNKKADNDDSANNEITVDDSKSSHTDHECSSLIGQDATQEDNETIEEFEERVLNKRARNLYQSIREIVSAQSEIIFSSLVETNNRKQAAQKFYSLLVLKKFKILELTQEEPYGEIIITRGPNFDNPKL